jgi:hypothetical protein
MKAPIPYRRRSRQPAGNEFLPKGYPLSYNANGTANFPPGYWSTSSGFRSIRNDGPGFTYSQYVNEFAQEAIVAPIGPVNLVVCSNLFTGQPWIADPTLCPALNGTGVANRSTTRDTLAQKEVVIEQTSLTIVPNPALNEIQIKLDGSIVRFKNLMILNAKGVECTSSTLYTSENLDVSQLPVGLYQLLYREGDKLFSGKLMIAR